MKQLKIIFFLFITVLLASCSSFKNITIEEIEHGKVRRQMGSKVTVELKIKVNNPTNYKLTLKKIKAEVLRNGYQFADIKLKQKVKIPKHTNTYHSVLIEFEVIDVLAVITGTVDLTNLDDSFTISGYVKGGIGLFCKKYKFNDVSMSDLYTIEYGSNTDEKATE